MALKLSAVPQSNVIQLQFGGALDLNLNLNLAPPPPVGYVLITANFGSYSVTSEASKVAYTLSSGNKIGLQAKYRDANGLDNASEAAQKTSSSAPYRMTISVSLGCPLSTRC